MRRMDDGRAVQPEVACIGMTFQLATIIGELTTRRITDPPEPMGTGHDAQRRIVGINRVKMDPHRQHSIDDCHRRFDVRDTLFHCPDRKTGQISPRGNGNRAVLMPAE